MDTSTKESNAGTTSAATNSPAVKARKIALWALGAILRRRTIFAAGMLATIVAAVVISQLFAKKQWESSGTLLYTPLTTAESTAAMYTPPDLKTLVSIAKEPSNLEALAQEFKIDVPVKVLTLLFDVTAPSGTKTIEFKLKWENRETGADMVNRLMEMFRNSVLEIRLKKIQDYSKGFEVNYQQSSARYETALKVLQDFNRSVASVDIGRELSLLNEGLIQLYAEMGRVRRSELNMAKQAKELDQKIAEMRRQEDVEGEKSRQFEAADETIADNRRRQDRLRELVSDEKTRQEVEAQLIAKRLEHKRVLKLANGSFAPKEELEKIAAEIAILNAKISDNEKISLWKAELERIDKIVVPKGKSKSQGSPIVQQTLTRRLELDLSMLGNKEEVQGLETEISERRERIDKLLAVNLKFLALSKDVETAEQEKQAAATALRETRKLQAMRVPDLVIVTPATPAPDPTSNRKLWLIGLFAGGLLLTTGFVLTFDHLKSEGPSAETISLNHGLAILERFDHLSPDPLSYEVVDSSGTLHLRRLALRLRQAIRTSSGLCLFSTINSMAGTAWLLVPLARCLARRDERVLIVDSAGLGDDSDCYEQLVEPMLDGKEFGGLSEYLSFRKDEIDDIVFPTTIAAVDCLPHGFSDIGVDSLATYRMSELIDILRDRYTFILFNGPRADHQVDLEILAARADGMIFVGSDLAGQSMKSIPSIKALSDLGAPILGSVVVGSVPEKVKRITKTNKKASAATVLDKSAHVR